MVRVIVLPSVRTRSEGDEFPGVGLDEALRTHHPTDAHLALYEVPGLEAWPRLKLSSPLRDACTFRLVAVDLDRDPHEPWTEAAIRSWTEQLLRALEAFPDLIPTYFHFTRRGARALYVTAPEDPIPVERFPGVASGLVREWRSLGFAADELYDWTRLIRLPYVVRDGVSTAEDPFVAGSLRHNPDATFSWRDLTPGTTTLRCSPDYEREPLPDERDCMDLLYVARGSAAPVLTNWRKAARKHSGDSNSYRYTAVAFCDAPLSTVHPRRNVAIQTLAGSACTRLRSLPETTPQHVYALLLEPVRLAARHDDPANNRSLPHELWKAVQGYWARDTLKAEQRRRAKQQAAQETLSLLDRVTEGVRAWRPDATSEWVRQHLILCSADGKTFRLLKPSGYYSDTPFSQKTVGPYAAQIGMGGLVPSSYEDDKGTTKWLTPSAITRDARVYTRTIARPGAPGATLEGDTFVLSLYHRRDLDPRFNPWVDKWLRAMAGRAYPQLEAWLSAALAIEEGPVPALSIAGDPGIGKGFLALGLADCFSNRAVAGARDLLGNFQSLLEQTPLLVVDEGLPLEGRRNAADAFRRVVGSAYIEINPKHRDAYQAQNRIRVMLTANDRDTLMSMVGRYVGEAGLEAIRQRILHIDMGPEGAAYLEGIGGREFTRGWVGPGGSDTLARHLLWLYHEVPRDLAGRFLVAGSLGDRIQTELRHSQPYVHQVAEALVALARGTHELVHVEGGQYWATAAAVQSWIRGKRLGDPGTKALGLALRTLSVSGPDRSTRRGRRAHWREINIPRVLDIAQEIGLSTSDLEAIVKENPEPRSRNGS